MQLSLFEENPVERPGLPASKPASSSPKTALLLPLPLAPQSRVSSSARQRQNKSDPRLYKHWREVRLRWFPERSDLDAYVLAWSTRCQKRTLASCNLSEKKVLVARELNYPNHYHWLEPLLYHEMCHAVLNSRFHDRRFYDLERRHPGIKVFDYWIDSGGWQQAVRSDRAKRAHQRRLLIGNS